jgi:hypothetical protein
MKYRFDLSILLKPCITVAFNICENNVATKE